MTSALIKIVNFNLNEMGNFMYPWQPLERGWILQVLCSAQRLFLVCLSVYLCAGYLKKLWTDPDEILWTGWACKKDELLRFWWRSRSIYWNLLSDYSPLKDRTKLTYSMISQKVVERFGWNLVDMLGLWKRRIDSILVKIQIRIRIWYFWK